MPEPTPRELALRYTVDRGMCVVPVPYLQKGPKIEGWPDLRLAVEDIPDYFNGKQMNIGGIMGCAQPGCKPYVDVDLDASEARRVAPYFLPPTGAVYGRKSSPRSHYLYTCADPPLYMEFVDPTDGEGLLEVRGLKRDGSVGLQSILPGSVRGRDPKKDPPDYEPEQVRWDKDGEAAMMPGEGLARDASKAAAAALIVKHYPDRRHNFHLPLAGGLLRLGWSVEDVRHFVRAICEAAGDPELANRLECVDDTASKYARGENVTGWPRVARFIGGTVVDAVREWLGVPPDGEAESRPAPRRAGTVTTQDYFSALADAGYTFRLNELDDTVEMNGTRLDDITRSTILNDLRDRGLKSAAWAEDAVNALAARDRYHPVLDFLRALKWDGRDHIAVLARHLKSNDPKWVELVLRRFFVGAVAKALDQQQNFVLVLAGPQNIGKSYFAAWQNPLGRRFHVELPIRPDDKDDRLRLIRNLTWEVGELGATTRRADVEALKSFVTLRDVTVRKPYGHHDIEKPALASFIGTINPSGSGFLTDTTGNRRFVPIEITSIDRDYTKRLDPGQVWAQALALYRAGEPWELNEQEATTRDEMNEQYMVDSAVEGFFHRTYRIEPDAQEWIPAADILQDMEFAGLKINQNEALKRLADLLKKEGVEKGRPREGGTGRPISYRGLRKIPGAGA
jgi:hypothetical protein